MSKFSGKCDLCDHIGGMGGWYDRDGRPVKFGDPDVNCYYSDEYEDFLAFKKLTNGVIHQHKRIKLNDWNREEVEKLCPQFKAIEHKRTVPDRRSKSGQREETYYTYVYYDKEYASAKELNKRGIWITIDIHFKTLLDLIPYYPYLVTFSCGSEVCISDRSYVDEEVDDHLDNGWYSDFWQHYKKQLQDHYREIVLTYFNPEGREHTESVVFDAVSGRGTVSRPIDENFEPEWRWPDGKKHSHWCEPKVIDAEAGIIEMSKEDLKMIGSPALVYYVETKESAYDPLEDLED